MKAHHITRILSCCYCGARSTLPRSGNTALICHGCGAPVHRIEEVQPILERRRKKDRKPRPATPHPAEHRGGHKPKDRPVRRKKGRRKKRGFWHGLKRLQDGAEDILDLFDLD